MKQRLNLESGYTLMITLGVLVLFSIIGLSIMTLSLNSVTKNESRESILQAKDLSVKGIDFTLAEIEYKMLEMPFSAPDLKTGQMKNYGPMKDGLKAEDYLSKFTGLLNSYLCSSNEQALINTETGQGTYCIETFKDKTDKNPYQKHVTFRSTGNSETKEHTTVATYELGVESTLDAFNYALTSYGYGPQSMQKGDIELHGGLQVIGDIHADRNFSISDYSKYKKSNLESIYPIISGTENTKSRLEVRNDHFLLENAISNNVITNEIPKALLPNTEIVEATDLNIDFKISEKISDAKFINIDKNNNVSFNSDVSVLRTNPGTIDNYGVSKTLMPPSYLKAVSMTGRKIKSTQPKIVLDRRYPQGENYYFDWYINGRNYVNAIAFPKSFYLQHGVYINPSIDVLDWSTSPEFTVNNFAYIDKNFIVGLDLKDEVNMDLFDNVLDLDLLGILSSLESMSNIETPVELNGTYYINNNFVVAGARLTGNATIFVNGNTNIIFSEIGVNGNNLPSDKNNITIISKGPVNISYIGNNHNDYMSAMKYPLNRLYQDDSNRSVWNGHIHSDERVTIDAATSYLTINGSISAPKIYATSIKGRAEPSCENLGTFLKDALRPILGALLGNILSSLLIGDAEKDNQLVRVSNAGGGSNCFQSKIDQSKESVPLSNYLLDALDLGVLNLNNNNYPLKPRLIITYSEQPKIDYMRFETFTEMDTPKPLSRE